MYSTTDNQKTKKRIFAVLTGVSVGLLHFVTGPHYSGPFPNFVNGYLIDILLPFVLFFLFTIHVRSIKWKIFTGLCILLFSCGVEIMQYLNYHLLGSTFDPFDLLMYFFGVSSAVILDLFLFPTRGVK